MSFILLSESEWDELRLALVNQREFSETVALDETADKDSHDWSRASIRRCNRLLKAINAEQGLCPMFIRKRHSVSQRAV